MNTANLAAPPPNGFPRIVNLLLNVAHGIDHMFLLIFATAVGAIAHDFQVERWEDMMPFTVGAFMMFGLGSIPSGRLGDQWGRRRMMLVFYYGMGVAAFLVALTQTPLQMAVALTLLGSLVPRVFTGSRTRTTCRLSGFMTKLPVEASSSFSRRQSSDQLFVYFQPW